MKSEIPSLAPGLYKHYKGKFYEVIDIALHTETLEPLVVYKSLYDDPRFGYYQLWTRPLEQFVAHVELEDGKQIERFKFIGPPK